MGHGNVGMGSINNNMDALGDLGNVFGMGGVRGAGETGISAPLGSFPDMGKIAQKPTKLSQTSNISNAISQQLCIGALTPQQAVLMENKLRMGYGIELHEYVGGSLSSMGGMTELDKYKDPKKGFRT